eukprot:3772636-Pleurochrysis_carterae.AAC.1
MLAKSVSKACTQHTMRAIFQTAIIQRRGLRKLYWKQKTDSKSLGIIIQFRLLAAVEKAINTVLNLADLLHETE